MVCIGRVCVCAGRFLSAERVSSLCRMAVEDEARGPTDTNCWAEKIVSLSTSNRRNTSQRNR